MLHVCWHGIRKLECGLKLPGLAKFDEQLESPAILILGIFRKYLTNLRHGCFSAGSFENAAGTLTERAGAKGCFTSTITGVETKESGDSPFSGEFKNAAAPATQKAMVVSPNQLPILRILIERLTAAGAHRRRSPC